MTCPCHPRAARSPHGGAGLSRRTLLSNLSLGLGAAAILPQLSLRRALAGQASDPTFLVVVNLFGGNDSMNMFVPFGLPAYYDARPHIGIPAGELLPVSIGEGLHPGLAAIHPRFAAGEMAIVRQVGYPDPNLSHFESTDIWSKGLRGLSAATDGRGWIGRMADLHLPGALDVVGVGVGRRGDFVANTAKPLVVNGLSSYGPGERAVPWNELSRRDAAAKAMLAAGDPLEATPGKDLRRSLRNAYDLVDLIHAADASYSSTVQYPQDEFGSRLQDCARLVQARLGSRVLYTGFGGFDTHAEQPGQHADLMTKLSTGLDAFIRDLEAMSAWDRAAIVVISEFGRRNYDNASAGTDHGHGMNLLVLGGRARGGLYGPAYDASVVRDQEFIPGAEDFRAVYSNVLRAHLGIEPVGQVFPEPWSGSQEIPIF